MGKYSKEEFKELLIRYNNGCEFLSQLNPNNDKYNFYLNKLLEILNRIYEITEKYPELIKEEDL